MKAKVQQELKQHFRPEFLNRIDDVIVFHQLTENEIIEIVDLMINSLEKRLEEQDMAIELTPGAKALLAHRGYDSSLGARPLRRTIQRDIEDPLSEKMLFGDMKPGSIVLVDVATDDGEEPFTFTATPKAELPDVPPVEAAGSPEGESLTG
jgi:ATP-dependent Clp protease ATP-binding subunit ClpC